MSDDFECNGLSFRIKRKQPGWMLYVREDAAWVSLSCWGTRSEAVDAAACFSPRLRAAAGLGKP